MQHWVEYYCYSCYYYLLLFFIMELTGLSSHTTIRHVTTSTRSFIQDFPRYERPESPPRLSSTTFFSTSPVHGKSNGFLRFWNRRYYHIWRMTILNAIIVTKMTKRLMELADLTKLIWLIFVHSRYFFSYWSLLLSCVYFTLLINAFVCTFWIC